MSSICTYLCSGFWNSDHSLRKGTRVILRQYLHFDALSTDDDLQHLKPSFRDASWFDKHCPRKLDSCSFRFLPSWIVIMPFELRLRSRMLR